MGGSGPSDPAVHLAERVCTPAIRLLNRFLSCSKIRLTWTDDRRGMRDLRAAPTLPSAARFDGRLRTQRPAPGPSSTSSCPSSTRSGRSRRASGACTRYLTAQLPVLVADHDRRQRVDGRHLDPRGRTRAGSFRACARSTSTGRAAASRCGARGARATPMSSPTWTSISRPISTRCCRSSRRSSRGTPMSRSVRGSRPDRTSPATRSGSSSRAATT